MGKPTPPSIYFPDVKGGKICRFDLLTGAVSFCNSEVDSPVGQLAEEWESEWRQCNKLAPHTSNEQSHVILSSNSNGSETESNHSSSEEESHAEIIDALAFSRRLNLQQAKSRSHHQHPRSEIQLTVIPVDYTLLGMREIVPHHLSREYYGKPQHIVCVRMANADQCEEFLNRVEWGVECDFYDLDSATGQLIVPNSRNFLFCVADQERARLRSHLFCDSEMITLWKSSGNYNLCCWLDQVSPHELFATNPSSPTERIMEGLTKLYNGTASARKKNSPKLLFQAPGTATQRGNTDRCSIEKYGDGDGPADFRLDFAPASLLQQCMTIYEATNFPALLVGKCDNEDLTELEIHWLDSWVRHRSVIEMTAAGIVQFGMENGMLHRGKLHLGFSSRKCLFGFTKSENEPSLQQEMFSWKPTTTKGRKKESRKKRKTEDNVELDQFIYTHPQLKELYTVEGMREHLKVSLFGEVRYASPIGQLLVKPCGELYLTANEEQHIPPFVREFASKVYKHPRLFVTFKNDFPNVRHPVLDMTDKAKKEFVQKLMTARDIKMDKHIYSESVMHEVQYEQGYEGKIVSGQPTNAQVDTLLESLAPLTDIATGRLAVFVVRPSEKPKTQPEITSSGFLETTNLTAASTVMSASHQSTSAAQSLPTSAASTFTQAEEDLATSCAKCVTGFKLLNLSTALALRLEINNHGCIERLVHLLFGGEGLL